MKSIRGCDVREGDTFPSKGFGDIEILKILPNTNQRALIKFIDTGAVLERYIPDVLLGRVRDPCSPSVCDVGFVGQGKYDSTQLIKGGKPYYIWKSMLARCYSARKSSCYEGVTVCEEWHNFQNFAKWFEENYVEGYELDKDIKIRGNKLYSPETCMFVPTDQNRREPSARKQKLTVLKDPSRGLHVFKNRKWFCNEVGLDPSAVCNLVAGNYKQTKGWKLVCVEETINE